MTFCRRAGKGHDGCLDHDRAERKPNQGIETFQNALQSDQWPVGELMRMSIHHGVISPMN